MSEKKQFKDTKVGSFLQQVAPSVIDTVGNFFPPAKMLKALLPEADLTPDQVREFDAALKEYELNELKEHLKDVQDARAMNVQIQQTDKASKLAKNAAYYLDFVIVGATIIIGMLLFFRAIPAQNQQVANIIFGSLLTLCGTVVNFHRGTSQGSSNKTDVIVQKLNSK